MTPRLRGTPQRAAPHLRADHAGARIPWQLGGPAVIGATFLLIPLFALLARVPWRDLPSLLTDPAIRDALRLSLLCASAATVISVVVGVPLAWLLAQSPVVIPIPGSSRPQTVLASVEATRISMSVREVGELTALPVQQASLYPDSEPGPPL